MSIRRPLEERVLANVPATLGPGSPLKKGVDGAMKEARALERGDGAMRELRAQLAAAEAELKIQKETIIRLSSSRASADSSGLKEKLGKLVEKYESTKAKHKAELDTAQTDNRSLQSVIETLQAASADMQKTVTSLRSDKAALSQKLRLAETASAAPARTSEIEAKHREERLAWRKEKAELEGQLRRVQKDAAKVEGLQREKDWVEEERDRLQETVSKMTYLYRSLYRSSVPRDELLAAKEELAITRSSLRRLRAEQAALRRDVRSAQASNNNLVEQLSGTRQQLGEALQLNQLILDECSADRALANAQYDRSAHNAVQPLPPFDPIPLIDVIFRHMELSSLSSSTLLATLLSTASALRVEVDSLQTSSLDAQTSLLSTKARAKELETKLAEAEAIHSGCAQNIQDWRGEANRAAATESRLRAELSDTKRTLEDVEGKAKEDRERLRRANEQNGRSGSAMQAMEDDLADLRSALGLQRELQDKLQGTEQDRILLQLRCHDLSDELERLGQMQADLMGHANEGQRISYMEGMRREMAIVKHELTTTRHNLNLANAQISSLSDEVASYKSLEPSALSAAPGRIRVSRSVMRKEPENGEVMGVSMARRGLSGRASHGWR